MTLTILFDLDDTLLNNSTDVFIPAFLKAFGNKLAHNTENPSEILPALVAATQKMSLNNDPSKTLKQVFDSEFYPSLNWDYPTLAPQILDFYHNTYSELRKLTSPNPASLGIVKEMIERGYSLVIATHPIFPQRAMQDRLDWAGLDNQKSNFSLVTSYENFHFAKPNLAYYTEILGQIGWPDTPVLMVGDDQEADIGPARQLGIATYWVTAQDGYAQHDGSPPCGSGRLDQLLTWLDSQTTEKLIPDFSSPAASIAILRSTPAALSTVIDNLPDPLWLASPSEKDWCLTEILCHLRDVDREISIPRIQEVIQSDRPFLEAVDADLWAEERNYKGQNGRQAFHDFTEARLELLNLVDSLPESAWEKDIRHTIFGPLPLQELLKISARHDKLHIQQAYETISDPSESN